MKRRAFTDDDARAAWSSGARAWDVFVEGGADHYRHYVHGPALLAACAPLAGHTALDLGCGQGFFTRELARAGATATGVDLCPELVALARQQEARAPLGVAYHAVSAVSVHDHFAAHGFDVVTACMSIQDMSDVGATLKSAHAVLTRDGRLVFSVPHPCTDTTVRTWERDEAGRKVALKIDRYFESGATLCDWNMPRLLYPWQTPCWQYTLTEWSELIADAAFLVRRVHEPRPTEAQVRDHPELEDCARLPYFLIFDLVKV